MPACSTDLLTILAAAPGESSSELSRQAEETLVQSYRQSAMRAEQAVAEANQLLIANEYDQAIALLKHGLTQQSHDAALTTSIEDSLDDAKLKQRVLAEARFSAMEGRTFLAAGMYADAARAFATGLLQPTHEQAVRRELQEGQDRARAGQDVRKMMGHAVACLQRRDFKPRFRQAAGLFEQVVASGFQNEALLAAEGLNDALRAQETLKQQSQAEGAANGLIANGDYSEAVKMLKTLLESGLLSSDSRATLTELHGQAVDHEKANDDAQALLEEGITLHAAGLFAESVATYDSGLQYERRVCINNDGFC